MGEGEKDLPGLGAAVDQIADPHCELYRSFGLAKAKLWQVLRPRVFLRASKVIARGLRGGRLAGDGLQLPGTFLIKDAEIVCSHLAEDVADLWQTAAFAKMLPD